jgi:hypothetical protein
MAALVRHKAGSLGYGVFGSGQGQRHDNKGGNLTVHPGCAGNVPL